MTDYTRYDLPERAAPVPTSASHPSVCTDCGGRGWRRSQGSVACACLVREVRAQTAAHHGLVDRLTVRLAEMEERIAEQAVEIAELRWRLESPEAREVHPGHFEHPEFTPHYLGGRTCNRCGTHWPAAWFGVIPPCACV